MIQNLHKMIERVQTFVYGRLEPCENGELFLYLLSLPSPFTSLIDAKRGITKKKAVQL